MENILDLESTVQIVLKGALIVFLGLYLIFSIVVIKQVRIMTETLQVGMEKTIKAVSIFHFIFALVVLILAIVIL